MRYAALLAISLLSLSCLTKGKEATPQEITPNDSVVPSRITLLFAGDLMQHQAQIDAARTTTDYDYSDCFALVRDEISRADIAVANLEVTLGGKPYRGYPAFSAPDEYLYALRDAGFNLLLTANNHCLDRGRKGLERTISLLDSLNIPSTGSYINSEEREKRYPLLVEKNNFRLVFLNYTYGSNGLTPQAPNVVNYIDKDIISADIARSKTMQPDAIIACMHWGNEYVSLPNKEQKALTDWLLAEGVTHIIGSHPHVVQPMEVRTDSISREKNLVVYSLGNFISNMSQEKTDGGLIVRMELTKDSTTRLSHCDYSLVWTSRPELSGRKNYRLIPAGYPSDSLSINERTRMDAFLKGSRKLFEKHNLEISERH